MVAGGNVSMARSGGSIDIEGDTLRLPARRSVMAVAACHQ